MDTELMLILTYKFRNKRVIRNIYEYNTGTRKYWLSIYRNCIHNGYIKNRCSHYKWPNRGVLTFQLSGNRSCLGKNHTKCYPGLHVHRSYSPMCWSFRIKDAEHSSYIKPENMKFSTKKALWKSCIDNDLAVSRFFIPNIDKKRYIELLMML